MAAKRETVIVVRKPKVDKLKPASGPTAEIPVLRCYVLPRSAQESDGGWVQISGLTVIAPVGSDIRADDQIRIRGELYAVEGVPGEYPVPQGKPGLFVTVERVSKVGT
jgi:hypothetical protein